MKRAATPTGSVTAHPTVVRDELELVDGGLFGLSFGLSIQIGRTRPPVVAAPPVVYRAAPVVYGSPVVAAPIYGVALC